MKKVFLPILTLFILLIAANEHASAQTPYRTAIGLGIDLGDGQTLFGPQIKHSFGGTNAGNAQVLFGDNITVIGADWSHNQRISGTNGLSWYIGVGPQLSFIDHGKWHYDWDDDDDHWKDGDTHTDFAIRPAVGLEFRIPSTPLAMHFDWKPWWNLSHGSHFEPSRFSLGFKFVLK
ncbi:hypothetical protein [Sphingobacterium endophyticum]|uniref:hypothetical protein n=1 Tax=Sphingobacterium endophyticum TaxID=2546448 RepID=UPI0012E18A1E|nr:hypothetical protein [Sphingobacterium endophyticum]